MDNDFIVQLIARLDASKTPDDLRKIEQELNKKKINLQTVLDAATTQKELKNLAKQMRDILKSEGIDIDTSTLLSSLKQAQKAIEQAGKAQQKAMRDAANEANRLAEILNKVEKAKGKSVVASKMFEGIDDVDNIKLSIKELEKLLSAFDSGASLKDQELAWIKIDNAVKALNVDIEKYNNSNNKNTSLDDEAAKFEALTKKIKNIRFSVESGNDSSEYANRIEKLKQDLEKYGISAEEAKKKTENLRSLLAGFKDDKGNWLPDEQIVAQADKIEQEFKAVKILVDSAKLSYDKFMQPVSKDKASTLINRINTFLTKNTAITQEAKTKLEGYIRELENGVNLSRWNEINSALKQTENSMRGLGRLGASLKNQMKQAAESFTQWLSVSSAIMLAVQKTREALTELKEVDTYLTEISKANDSLSKTDLIGIGDRSFETASQYGKKATDYLAGVQEMSRAGYQNAEAMGELSVKAQGAGDMTEDVANKFIVATDKAYKLNGSLTDLTKIMDGINYITNHNAINMTELSEGFSIVGSTAASFGVEANELTAALATMGASTQQSGSEVARAFRAILLNIRQVSDEEEGIDAEGLTKYENACNALGVSLKKTVNGVQELRDPMEVLGELSKKYKELSDTDIKKVNLLNSVGGKLRATQLDALLRGWEDYEKMLGQFEAGTGSMQKEAEKTANSWEGSMNRLSNTWTDTIGNIANSSAVTGLVNGLNGVLTIVNGITSALGTFGTVGLSVIALMAKNGITFRDVWTSITGGVKMNAPKYARHTAVVTLNELMMNMVSLTRLYVAMPEME
jgi:TP901 family phage tail tape measure protein